MQRYAPSCFGMDTQLVVFSKRSVTGARAHNHEGATFQAFLCVVRGRNFTAVFSGPCSVAQRVQPHTSSRLLIGKPTPAVMPSQIQMSSACRSLGSGPCVVLLDSNLPRFLSMKHSANSNLINVPGIDAEANQAATES
jgi:hypothetical protein